jgi:deoxyribonuclease-4
MDSAVTDLYVVLPLQAEVWHCNLSTWTSREKYRDALNAYAKKILNPAPKADPTPTVSQSDVLRLCDTYKIGFHAPKFKTLLASVQAFPDPRKPYQIFLGSPQSNKFSVSDGDCAATSAYIGLTNLKVFVHSPYIINLATDAGDNWNVSLLKRNLECANAIGCKGVVVHVGKSTTQSYAAALDTMRKNMLLCLDSATPACPLLLETPAGQGTEMLKPITEFIEFVASFADPRLRLCIDTCHVFACGHDPITYINQAGDLTHLIHYNDSMEACGSCKDRHAIVGTGKIGLEKMTTIAKRCQELNLPMVIE